MGVGLGVGVGPEKLKRLKKAISSKNCPISGSIEKSENALQKSEGVMVTRPTLKKTTDGKIQFIINSINAKSDKKTVKEDSEKTCLMINLWQGYIEQFVTKFQKKEEIYDLFKNYIDFVQETDFSQILV